MGMAVGHIYYFLEDVFPKQRGGFRILKTPLFLWVYLQISLFVFLLSSILFLIVWFYRRKLFDESPELDTNYTPLPEDRPGGFNWGEEQAQNNQAGNDE